MSDYLTNLVIRSFAPVATVQPLGAQPYASPGAFGTPTAEFSDPFAEPAILGDDATAKTDEVTPQRKRSPRKVMLPEAPIGIDQEPVETPLGNIQRVATTPPSGELPDRTESAASRSQSKPTLSKKAVAKPDEAPRMLAGFDEREPKRNVVRSTRAADAASINAADAANINRDTLYFPPIDTGHSTRQLMKRRAKGVSLSPQTSATHFPGDISAAPDKLQPPAVVESVVERTTTPIEERQPTTAPLTTLIPKTSAQPLLPVNVKTRPNLQSRHAPDGTAAQVPLTETIINVAIGRIEVRATPFESPRRERQSNGPKVMNLDDYLQQRSRGNR